MIYLSQLILNPRNRQAQRDLSDCHELHRTVLRAFPNAPEPHSARDYFGVLHRVDEVYRMRRCIALLVQSSTKPAWSFLSPGYLEAGTTPAVKRVDDVYGGITTGSTLRFRLRANPTKRVWKVDEEVSERWKSKRVDLRTEDAQLTWLERKGRIDAEKQGGGFQLVDVRVRPDVRNVAVVPGGAVHGRKESKRLTFGSVLFDGVLRVTDATAFSDTLVEGIGSGKAYGFGLLSIAPA